VRSVVAVLVITLILGGVAAGAYLATDRFLASAYASRPALVNPEPDPGENGPPLTERLVVIIVDGWRTDALSVMPFTDELWARGASAMLHLTPPTYDAAGWATLLTGATPEMLGLPLLPAPEWPGPRLPAGSLVGLAAAAGRACAVADHAAWEGYYQDGCAARLFVPGDDATADAQVAAGARDMEQGRPALMLVHFRHLARAGRAYGATSTRYLQAARALDDMIRQVAEPALADEATIAVVSGHGLSDSGGFGGADLGSTQVPFFLVGPGVIPGGYGTIRDVDVAPTLAALIGLPAPPLAVGHVRYDMLAGDGPWQTGRHLRMAAQRLRLAEVYLANLGFGMGGLADLSDRVAQAERTFQSGDAEAAWQTANAVLHEVNALMREARQAALSRERGPRFVLAMIGLVLAGILWGIWQRRRAWLTAVAAGLGILVVHLAFWIGGGCYSLSSVARVEEFLMATLWQAGLGALVAIALLVIWRVWRRPRGAPNIAIDVLGMAWAMMWIWAWPVAIGYWQHGAAVSWHIPDVTLAFWHLWGLTQLWSIPLFVLPIAWLLALIGVLTRRMWGSR